MMGGYSSTVEESNPAFRMPEQHLLQIASKQTIWTFSSAHWTLEDAIDAAMLQIGFNQSLVMRVINSLSLEVEWESNNIADFQQAQGKTLGQQALGIGGIS